MKKVSLLITIVSFDGVDLVSHTESVNFKKDIKKTIEKVVAKFSNGDFVSKLLDVSEDKNKLIISYYITIDYDDILDEVTKLFQPFDENVDSDLMQELKSDVEQFNPIVLRMLLGNLFTIDDLHYLYELVLGESFDKGNFHKIVKKKDWLKPTKKFLNKVKYRPPRLYTITFKK